MSEAVRPGLELGISQPLAFAYDSDRLRRPHRLRLDQLMHAPVLRDVGLGRVPLDQHPMTLRLAKQRQPINRPRLIRRQARRLDRRRCGTGAPERYPQLTIGMPQCRPQNCCLIRPNFSVEPLSRTAEGSLVLGCQKRQSNQPRACDRID